MQKWIILALLCCLTGVTQAQANTDTVSLTTNETLNNLKSGDTFTVNVDVSIVTPIAGYGFQIRYDSSILDIVPDERTKQLFRVGTALADTPEFKLAQSSNTERDYSASMHDLDVVYVYLPTHHNSAQGILGNVIFQVKDAVGSTTISLENPRFYKMESDDNPQQIPITIVNREINVGFISTSPATPTLQAIPTVTPPVAPPLEDETKTQTIAIGMGLIVVAAIGGFYLFVWLPLRRKRK